MSYDNNPLYIYYLYIAFLDTFLINLQYFVSGQLVGGVSIDNVHFMDNGLNAAGVTDLYDRESKIRNRMGSE